MPVPALPRSRKGLDEAQWKSVVDGTPAYLPRLVEMRSRDQKAIESIVELLPAMTAEGKSNARLMMNRLEVRRLYAKSLWKLYSAFTEYDRIARDQGIDIASESMKPQFAECVSYARMMIEKYAEQVKNRGDQGVIAQLNEQYYQVLKRLLGEVDRVAYATVDWTAFRIKPWLTFDLAGQSWTPRDGKVEITKDTVDGRPTLRLKIGGDGVQYNSAFMHMGSIDLDKAPYMDFRVRTSSDEPLAILFQLDGGSQTWYALNLIGDNGLFNRADGLSEDALSDGKWHRVTWDLKRLVREGIARNDREITNLVIGSWKTPKEPVVVEFQDFSLGTRNMLD